MPGINGHNPQAYLGSWKNWDAVSGNISGTWRTSSDVYVNHNGTWKQVWVRLTAPTAGSTSLSDVTATISWTAGVGQEGFKLYRNGTFVKNVTSGTSTTDSLPTLNDTYTYTVSAYAGATETAQISCGAGVSQGVGTPTSSVSINTDWAYTNNDWNGNQIVFNTSCTEVANATDYQYSLSNPPHEVVGTQAGRSTTFNMNEDEIYYVRWRARRTYNGVTYTGPYSNTNTVNAGQPLKRNASQNFNYNKTAFRGETIGETVNFTGGFGTVIDSYQFRNVDAVGSSLLANDTRRVIFRRPSGAGGDISIPFGSSPTSGTSDNSGDYVQGPFTNYVDGTYSISLISASSGVGGWSSSTSGVYLTFTIRFTGRSISQSAVAYSIT
jgi:hypothetical protein